MPPSDLTLTSFEADRTSQGGEDGVIAELLHRIGTTNKTFVEFGAERGTEGNTLKLAAEGWSGLLIEGDPEKAAQLKANQASDNVTCIEAFVFPDNIDDLCDEAGIPEEPDVFSIDTDGNDWWILEALRRRPRLLICEYNGQLPLEHPIVMPFNRDHAWSEDDYYGASLAAFEQLAAEKGYTLVHTNQWGVNAFFVRNDVFDANKDKLPEPDDVPRHATNIALQNVSHPRDPQNRPWLDLETGKLIQFSAPAPQYNTELQVLNAGDASAFVPDLVRGETLDEQAVRDAYLRVSHAFEGGADHRRALYSEYVQFLDADDVVLDVGCGDGTWLKILKENGIRGIGIDYDPIKVEQCRSQGLEVICSDDLTAAAHLNPTVLTAFHIIEHLQPMDVLRLLMTLDVQKTIMLTPNIDHPPVLANFWKDITHTRPYPRQVVEQMVVQTGFAGIASGTQNEGMDSWVVGVKRGKNA